MRPFVTFIALISLASTALGEGIPAGKARPPQRLFLTIGVSNYQDPYWRSLKFAAKDAEDIAAKLKPSFDGGWTLAAGVSSQVVTRDDIKAAFARLAMANESEQDTVVIYISGHGTIGRRFDSGRQTMAIEKYVVASDTQSKDPVATGFAHSDLMEMFKALRSRRKVIIFDTCYSGEGKSKLTPAMVELLSRQKSAFTAEPEDDTVEGSIVLAASAWGEEALESERYTNGLYTHFLIEGFGSDTNTDGAITITEAHSYATEHVVAESQGTQHPSAQINLVGHDPIVVAGQAGSSRRHPILFAYEWALRKLEVSINGENKGALTKGGLVVPEGRVKLQMTDPKTSQVVAERIVTFKEGQEYSAAQFIYPRQPNGVMVTAGAEGFATSSFRRMVAPGRRSGFGLEYRREDGWLNADWLVGIQYFPMRSEMIDSDGVAVQQEATLTRGTFALGMRRELNVLSKADHSVITEWSAAAGPSMIRVTRRLLAAEFDEPHQSGTLGGGALHLGVETSLLATQFRMSAITEWGVYRVPGFAGGGLAHELSVMIGSGMFW